ncbi:uncharacterized protein MYCFIDRAFT_171401 [Pseudocercospora fijiensis CIRAD86]|uniref:Uncharacterized protein n=1 Tax=Pseudocercospora fijiensis (strain CIRAD86) TaxID=383855 RepID=M3B825_PSEFD|nr:uncharacterized protein MYCFIDRAFT_171401 [Pseudocercospora fijiensis CIRAD86]EME85473.1 hypothetical protein MYCFIDRAFT_171401 [Pseudocercospora fijiensis CIRAD86]
MISSFGCMQNARSVAADPIFYRGENWHLMLGYCFVSHIHQANHVEEEVMTAESDQPGIYQVAKYLLEARTISPRPRLSLITCEIDTHARKYTALVGFNTDAGTDRIGRNENEENAGKSPDEDR